MKTTISKYKNKGSINLGDGLYLDLFIGMTQEGGGGDTSNIKTITSGYSEGYELQQVFSIPQGHSVIMAVRVSTMATTYTDLLRYSCSGDTSVQNFYCDNIIYFTENKALPTIGYPVCIKAKNSPYAPASKYTFKVLYASCGVDKITWYDNVFVNRKAYARENERLTLKNDPIDEDAETTQVLATDAQGALDGLDLQNYTDFIIDTSASSGSCTFSPASFKPDNIYRIMFSEDGEVNFTDIPNCQDATAQVKGDSIVSIVFQEGTNGEYYLAIDQQPIEVYYTKEETDNLIDEKISEIDLSDVVHKSGAEAITGNKDFRNSTPRFTTMYIGLGSRLLTYSNVGFDFEGYIQASSGRIEPEGLYSVMLVSGRAVYNALQAYLKKADIATTLDGATDDKVPSAKCVADALEDISFDDTNLVHKLGTEYITGHKYFDNIVTCNNSLELIESVGRGFSITSIQNLSTQERFLEICKSVPNSSNPTLVKISEDGGIWIMQPTPNKQILITPISINFQNSVGTNLCSLALNVSQQLQSTAPMTAPKTQLIGANDTELTRGMDVFTFVNDLLTGKANDDVVIKSIVLNGVTYTPTTNEVNLGSVLTEQAQADWNEADTTKADYIKNKPTIPSDANLVHKSGAETIAGTKTFSDGVVLQSSGTIASGSARAVNGGAVYDALNAKADDSGVVHKTGDESIAGTKSFTSTIKFGSGSAAIDLVKNGSALEFQKATLLRLQRVYTSSERHIALNVYGSVEGSAAYPRLVAQIKDTSGDDPVTTETTSVALRDDKVSFALNRTTEWGFVNATSNSNENWNTKEIPTKAAVAAKITEEIASANEIGAVNQSFAQGGVQDITLAQTSHYKTTYVRVTCATQINIQVLTPNAVVGDILIIDSSRCEAGGVCFRPVKYSSNAGYHAFDVCENTAVTYGSTNFQTLIKWYYNGTSWQRLEKTICGPLANVSDL